MVTEITFSSLFSKIVISTALVLIIVGKVVAITKKGKKDKSISMDIGIIIGTLIVLISRLLNSV